MTPSEFISADVRRKQDDIENSGHVDGKEAVVIFGTDLLKDETFMEFIVAGADFAAKGKLNAYAVAMAWIHLGYKAAMETLGRA